MITTRQIEWTAGFLEGEGSFIFAGTSSMVAAVQVQMEPLLRLKAIFGGTICLQSKGIPPRQVSHRWAANGRLAVGLMMTLYQLMSPRRKGQIRVALARWRTLAAHPRYRTHCPSGHPYDETNTIRSPGKRECRTCKNATARRIWPAYSGSVTCPTCRVRTKTLRGRQCRSCNAARARSFRKPRRLASAIGL